MSNIIFDFDGTIADTFPMVVSMVSRWIGPKKKIDASEIERLRNMPIHAIIEDLKIAPWRVPAMVVRGRLEMGRHIKEVQAFDGMPRVVKELHESGHTLYVVSSNSRRNIRLFLKQNGLKGNFKRVYAGIGLLGKASILKKVLKDNDLSYQHTYYVGDEVRDIHAAQKAQIQVLAVTWGYNGQKILEDAKPLAVVSKPSDLLKILKS